ncbi:MAG: A/G-specific adenine glycosylase [Lachnospiraceae bacterium]|nr:A/G-specific adenine glycosylase [Lachnospiraceae bacterium]
MALLRWYQKNKRDLPWRSEDPDPYRIWVSEIMLQQTRVEAVRGYYTRFLGAFPDVRSLAEADTDTVLKYWEGLGYYSRAANLQAGARQVMEEYGGKIPDNAAELRKIKGIGDYTAGAVASIAFGEKCAAIDGNLLRIFARLTAYTENIRTQKAKKAAESYFLGQMPAEGPPNVYGDINQALMDLGAEICVPSRLNQRPDCSQCPLAGSCRAYRAGMETALPVMPEKKNRRIEERTVFVIRDNERFVLRQRPAKGLLAGLYEYPNTEGRLERKEALRYVETLGFSPVRIMELPDAVHVFSHVEWYMKGYAVWVDELSPENAGKNGYFTASEEEISRKYSIPSAFGAYRAV